ncbi:branched-chain amino acid aminotransferase [Mammaliicoccus fleurettii]|uniref:branched-chain amino acid aminotransferase n=1 Tax=Mammaliicoccus fleurettii TaxID=150056 RepID=UPI002DBC40AA|nr:branched-chain amino acid aminotransferase [Mammaliicoccus fleurettii]MEB7805431.1 branched-chain amino acid aminotransferase [Mammaliicoccus fleurettii]
MNNKTLNKSTSVERSDESESQFGNKMLYLSYESTTGWSSPQIKPYAPITISPSAQCLHYGQTVFEDMIAFNINHSTHIFKLHAHLEKFNTSLKRIEMPEVEIESLISGINQLINDEQEFFQNDNNSSIYIRTVMFASESKLGVSKSETYELITFISSLPTNSNYNLPSPLKVYVEDNYVKSVPGGAGYTQFGGNYASSYLATLNASQLGYDQVLWLDGINRNYIQEIGNMNVFLVINNQIITPSLNGSIVPGITRQSVIELAADLGYQVTERQISIKEVFESYKEGKLTEIFCTNTLHTITPVSEIKYNEDILTINNHSAGSITQDLFNTYTSIQNRTLPDKHNWNYSIEEAVKI